MRNSLWLLLTAVCCAVALAEELPVIRDVHYPDLNHDGSQIAFSYRGDIWIADVKDGIARRLTVHEGYDYWPRFSPDGRTIAFTSDRHGRDNVYTVPASAGEVRRLTHLRGELADWSPDGSTLLFSAGWRDQQAGCPYEIEVATGFVRPVFKDVYSVAVDGYSPDGRYVCGARPTPSRWWRKGERGPATPDVFVYDIEADEMQVFEEFDGPDCWPCFTADGSEIYFVSEREGRPNVFAIDVETRKARALTSFKQDAVTFLSISGDRKWLVFEWNFDVYRMPVTGGKPQKITLRAPIDYRSTFETEETVSEGIQGMAVNRDGSLVALRVRDDIFLIKPDLKDDAIRVTDWPGQESDLIWSPDGKQLAFVSSRNGTKDIWVADAETLETHCLVRDGERYPWPVEYTRDGKRILFQHGPREATGLFAVDVQTGEVTNILPEPGMRGVKLSPDGRWVLAGLSDRGANVFVRSVEDGEWVNLTKGLRGGWQQWSPDGSRIAFVSWPEEMEGYSEIYVTDTKRPPPDFDDYEEQLAEKAEEEQAQPPDEEKQPWRPHFIDPFDIDLFRIDKRARRITHTPADDYSLHFLPDGKSLVHIAWTREDKTEIRRIDVAGENQHTLYRGGSSLWGLSVQDDGKALFFIENGKPMRLRIEDIPEEEFDEDDLPKPKEIKWKATIRRDAREIQKASFDQAWSSLTEGFYHSRFHGVDWGAVYERYAPYCDGTLPTRDFTHLVSRVMGELNASHLYCGGGPRPPGIPPSYLGVTADPEHQGPGVKIAEVLTDGPADVPKSRLKVGEYIMAIDGQPVRNNESFHAALMEWTGPRNRLLVSEKPSLDETREVSVKPISTLYYLWYEQWVRENREKVRGLADGRILYVHLRGMSLWPEATREILSAGDEYEALLIDTRNNGGGFGFDEMFELLERTPHSQRIRGGGVPFGVPVEQFAGPKALLTNQGGWSGAEIFSNGFREKKIGKIIGVATAGGVIGTSTWRLINGVTFRTPLDGWFTLDGTDMENMGAKPDIEVPFPYEAYRDGRDPQIEKAVEVLLAELEAASSAETAEEDE